jgi:rod shape-determining protein MreC
VYDKTVRRRRAVLALLVVSSIVLLTASFGGSGGVSSVQRGVFEVISPIQDGASRALKPFRDLFGWVGDTLDAKGQNADLRTERDRLRRQVVDEQLVLGENAQMRSQLNLNKRLSLDRLDPVQARVQGTSTSLFSQTINIDKGSSDGLRTGQPVMTGAGLVGKVSFVASGAGKVTLLTDSTFRAAARTSGGVTGVVKPAAGSPNDLVMNQLAASDQVTKGDLVATRGTDPTATRFPSLFPPGIPIGTVTGVDDPGTDTQQVHIKPFVDVRRLDFVQILRRTIGGSGT